VNCGTTFTSIEAVDLSGNVTVKNNKALEPFQRDKLLLSIYDSLKHRKSALSDATGLTDTVISALYPLMQNAVIQKLDIVQAATKTLRRFDKAAATYYQAFHPGE
jgi:transcriptional regulator NrdR family protein